MPNNPNNNFIVYNRIRVYKEIKDNKKESDCKFNYLEINNSQNKNSKNNNSNNNKYFLI
jgi:hypothetical protein